MNLALEVYRSVPRYLAARMVKSRAPGLRGLLAGPVAPLRLVSRDDPQPPAEGWARVRPLLAGICGSDLSTIGGGSSFYFSSVVSLPFVPGHEVVGRLLDDVDGFARGQRVVIDPLLGCAARGIEPACDSCAEGAPNLCERVTGGLVSEGLQTGYCRDTGGGWSQMLVAHRTQMHAVSDDVTDEGAVMVEPAACALHAVRRARVPRDATVLIVGAGTVGLLTLIALKGFAEAGRIIVVAKHKRQAELANRFGAAEVVSPGEAVGAVRRATRAFRLDPQRSAPYLLGGVDVAFECTGSSAALGLALRTTRARGTVVLSGMPSSTDLSPAWFRELEVVGAYSGAGAFADAFALAADGEIGKLVSATYPLSNWRAAIGHALAAGSLGATKIAFDPQLE